VATLLWWLIPIGATVLAVAFVMLRARPAKPTTASDSMENLRAMRRAMERPLPPEDGPEQDSSRGAPAGDGS
jgi:cytochrome c-type biogenesis protein CcmH/NrfF